MESFVNNGYIILKKAIPNSLVIKIQQSILNSLGSISKNNVNKNYEIFSKKILSMDKSISPYDLLVDPYIDLEKNRLIHKMLNSKKIYSEVVNLIGKDLSFVNDPSLILNIPKKTLVKRIIYLKIGIKRFGQERVILLCRHGHHVFKDLQIVVKLN